MGMPVITMREKSVSLLNVYLVHILINTTEIRQKESFFEKPHKKICRIKNTLYLCTAFKKKVCRIDAWRDG